MAKLVQETRSKKPISVSHYKIAHKEQKLTVQPNFLFPDQTTFNLHAQSL